MKKESFFCKLLKPPKDDNYTDYGTETEVSAPLNRKFNIFTKFPKRGFNANFHKRNKYVLHN